MSRARYGSHMYNCYVRDRGRCTASGSRAPLATVSKNRSKIRNVCQILLCCLKGNKVIQGWTNTISCCTVSEMILGITNDVLQNSFSKLLNRGAKNTVNSVHRLWWNPTTCLTKHREINSEKDNDVFRVDCWTSLMEAISQLRVLLSRCL